MRRRTALLCTLTLCIAALSSCSATAPPPSPDRAALQREVTETERAFAKTMADRDHAAFTRFLSDETVFFSGPVPLHGKDAVAVWWKRFYDKPAAPFSWRPERVEVLASGTLAISTGPVIDASGKPVASFTSIWRREASGVWRIVFDKGCDCVDR